MHSSQIWKTVFTFSFENKETRALLFFEVTNKKAEMGWKNCVIGDRKKNKIES